MVHQDFWSIFPAVFPMFFSGSGVTAFRTKPILLLLPGGYAHLIVCILNQIGFILSYGAFYSPTRRSLFSSRWMDCFSILLRNWASAAVLISTGSEGTSNRALTVALGALLLAEQMPLRNNAGTLSSIAQTVLKDVRAHQTSATDVSLGTIMALYPHHLLLSRAPLRLYGPLTVP